MITDSYRKDGRRLLAFLVLALLVHVVLWFGWQWLGGGAVPDASRGTLHVGLVVSTTPVSAPGSIAPATNAPVPRPTAPVKPPAPEKSTLSAPAETGSHTAAESGTAPAAPVASTVSDAERKSWYGEVNNRIAGAMRYPRLARLRGEEGLVVLRFELGRDGKLVSSAVAQGSGHPALDEAALALLVRATPFPPPPPALATDDLRLQVPVNYSLEH